MKSNTDDMVTKFAEYKWIYFVEYTIYPFIVFCIIYWAVHKKKKNSFYVGLPRTLEILAENWGELTITFLCSVLLFELRLRFDGLPFFYRLNNQVGIDPHRTASFLTLAATLILFLPFFGILLRNKHIRLADPENRSVVVSINLAAVPLIVLTQLLVLTLAYFDIWIRVVIPTVALAFLIFYFYKKSFTSSFWQHLAMKLDTASTQIDGKIASLRYYIKAYKATGDSEPEYKFNAAIDCVEKTKYIKDNYIIGSDKELEFHGLCSEVKKIINESVDIARSKQHPYYDVLQEQSELLKK